MGYSFIILMSKRTPFDYLRASCNDWNLIARVIKQTRCNSLSIVIKTYSDGINNNKIPEFIDVVSP